MSVYFGLSAGIQMLDISFFNFALQNNVFAKCVIKSNVSGGNVYGGAVSVYIGAYSSQYYPYGDAVAAVGDTVARKLSIMLESILFDSCSAMRVMNVQHFFRGASVYGGSFSFYVGGYAWSLSNSFHDKSSSSTCGTTNASDVKVFVQNVTSFQSQALASNSKGLSYGVNSYGGSMSVLYIGAYSWSYSNAAFRNSRSTCGATYASGLSIHVNHSTCVYCRSLSMVGGRFSNGANSYGGSMSMLYVGAYSWSWSDTVSSNSSSVCENTAAMSVSLVVNGFTCSNCSASSINSGTSSGANVYGGSFSAIFVGAYAYSYASGAEKKSSYSIVRDTKVDCLLITIRNVMILNALASSGQYVPKLLALLSLPQFS